MILLQISRRSTPNDPSETEKGLTIVFLADIDHNPSTDVDLPLGGVVLKLAQDLLLCAVSPSVLLAPHEVSIQLCLGDQKVQLPLLTLSLMGHTGRTVRMMF